MKTGENMTEEDDRYSKRSEMIEFIEENREILEDLIRREKREAERVHRKNKDKVRKKVNRAKRETKASMRQTFDALTDPDIQVHFMTAGFEFITGLNALIREMPQPFADYDEYDEEDYDEDGEENKKSKRSPRSIEITAPEEDEVAEEPVEEETAKTTSRSTSGTRKRSTTKKSED